MSINLLSSDFEKIEFRNIYFQDNQNTISGQLYKPMTASSSNQLPAVVLAHGVSNAKETMSDIALELSRQNIISLSIDELAHGNSDGQRSNNNDDPTLGMLGAIKYLESQPYVDKSNIGLIGHSMGASAARESAYLHGSINAVILIGGGISLGSENFENKINSTFPHNLLLAIGEHDILFDLEELTNQDLLPIFNTSTSITRNTIYGDFKDSTARKLITPSTIHLLEPIDPSIVSSSVNWIVSALITKEIVNNIDDPLIWTYQIRTISYIGYFVSIISILILLIIIADRKSNGNKNSEKNNYDDSLEINIKHLLMFSTLSLLLFFPLLIIGAIIPFPPVFFGSSLAWWLLGLGLLAVAIYKVILIKTNNNYPKIIEIIKKEINYDQIGLVLLLFFGIFTFIVSVENFLFVNVRILVPMFNDLFPPTRIIIFLIFIPFFLVFSFGDVLMTTRFNSIFKNYDSSPKLSEVVIVILSKILPFILIICIQIIPMLLIGYRPFPSIIGFFMEFLYLILPLLVISSLIAIIIYKYTNKTGYSILLNTLLFSWISAGLFPIL